jgi:hypothetical protein
MNPLSIKAKLMCCVLPVAPPWSVVGQAIGFEYHDINDIYSKIGGRCSTLIDGKLRSPMISNFVVPIFDNLQESWKSMWWEI